MQARLLFAECEEFVRSQNDEKLIEKSLCYYAEYLCNIIPKEFNVYSNVICSAETLESFGFLPTPIKRYF